MTSVSVGHLFEYLTLLAERASCHFSQSEMRTGYFDDIKRFRDSRGKVIETSKELVPAAIANAFPETKVPEF